MSNARRPHNPPEIPQRWLAEVSDNDSSLWNVWSPDGTLAASNLRWDQMQALSDERGVTIYGRVTGSVVAPRDTNSRAASERSE